MPFDVIDVADVVIAPDSFWAGAYAAAVYAAVGVQFVPVQSAAPMQMPP